jgi:mannose-6-phosphate isomerase-like protein (cupin superfamily)
MHRHPHSAKILYLIKGHARLLGPEGVAPVKLDEGAAAFVPAGYPHVIENMGRQSTAVFLQAFSPPGPERVYRDATDARGRAEFEVIRDPAQAKLPPEEAGKVLVTAAVDAKPVPLPRGIGSGKDLIPASPGQAMSLSLMELADGAEWEGKGDAQATLVLYFVSGTGSLKVAGETLPLAAQSMVYLPHGTPYTMKVAAPKVTAPDKAEKILVVRFRVGDPAKVRGSAPSGGAVRR